jgi:hypothetical protein
MKLKLSILILSVALITGCAAYTIHPGAVSVTESKVYDAVNDAKNTIDIASSQLASGALPVRFKPLVNNLIAAYNVAYPALKAYDDAVHSGKPSDVALTQLTAAKAALDSALLAFKGAK